MTTQTDLILADRHRDDEEKRRIREELESDRAEVSQRRLELFLAIFSVAGITGLFAWINTDLLNAELIDRTSPKDTWLLLEIGVFAVLLLALGVVYWNGRRNRRNDDEASDPIPSAARPAPVIDMTDLVFHRIDELPPMVEPTPAEVEAGITQERLDRLAARPAVVALIVDRLAAHRAGGPPPAARVLDDDPELYGYPTLDQLTIAHCQRILARHAYDTVLDPSFSADELMSFESVVGEMATPGRISLLVASHPDHGVVAAAVTDFDQTTGIELLSYLATVPEARSTGIGQEMLRVLRERWSELRRALVVGEIHDPRRWEDTIDERSSARLTFYGRNGCHVLDVPWVQPSLGAQSNRVEDMLLIVLFQRDGMPTPVDAPTIHTWALGYFLECELPAPTDRTFTALMARFGDGQPGRIDVVPLDEYRSVDLLTLG